MSRKKKRFNPFNPLLALVGLAFALTACGYGVMIYQETQQVGPMMEETSEEDRVGFTELMNKHGTTVLCVELIALAIFTFGSIALDQYWMKRDERTAKTEKSDSSNDEPVEKELKT